MVETIVHFFVIIGDDRIGQIDCTVASVPIDDTTPLMEYIILPLSQLRIAWYVVEFP